MKVSNPYLSGETPLWTLSEFDALGRTTRVTAVDGSVSTTSYAANTTTVVDPAGKRKKFTYDAFGALTQVAEPDAGGNLTVLTNYTYDTAGRLTLVSMNGGAQTRSFTYNAYGQVLTATNPENGTATYTYNADGSLASKTDAKNQRMNFEYDTYHRVTRIYPPAGASYGIEKRFYYDGYDPDPGDYNYGRLAAIEWTPPPVQAGSAWVTTSYAQSFGYTSYGAVGHSKLTTSVDYGRGDPPEVGSSQAGFDWTMQGEVWHIGYPSGREAFYKFDAAGRPNGLSYGAPSLVLVYDGGAWVWRDGYVHQDLVTGAGYNKAGQLATIDFAGNARETRTYNDLLQLTGIRNANTSTNAAFGIDLSYVYPAGTNNGRISGEVDNLTNTRTDYTYDQLSRLQTAASSTGGTTNWGLSFGYDVYGNRTAQTVTAGSAPQFAAQFDNNNRMTVPATSYDANGNQLTTPDGAALEYDWDNRMTRWTKGGVTEQYWYTPAGGRVRKWSSAGTDKGYFYGPGGQLLEDSDNGTYVYFGGRLVYTLKSGTYQYSPMVITRIYTDRLGSTRATETSPWRNFYPFGEEIGTPSTNDQYKFASTYRDSTTGLDYALNRYYASGTGRFLTPDPYSGSAGPSSPQSWNRYNYTLNDPVNASDPSGLDIFWYFSRPSSPAPSGVGGGGGTGGSQDMEVVNEGDAPPKEEGGGGGASPKEIAAWARTAQMMSTAVSTALAALADSNHPNCAGLFGSGGNSLDPSDVLKALSSGTSSYGYIAYAAISSKPGTMTNATTTPTFAYSYTASGQAVNQGINGVVVTINNDPNAPFNTGTDVDRAVTLLHELGHVFNLLPGAGGSKVVDDADNTSQSGANTALVKKNCFGK